MIHHLFGPVPSRRLGISLGVDIIPYKTCTLNCLYCECGPTRVLTLERGRFLDPEIVLTELHETLPRIPHLDHITFSGSGEPTLSRDIGRFIAEIKKISTVPVAVLTNGTLLHRSDVRGELLAADLVLPSLDAATAAGFQCINQPHEDLALESLLSGLQTFRSEYAGRIWLEVFLLKGINDTPAELDALHEQIRTIRPDRVQLNTLDRPPAFSGVTAVDLTFLDDVRRRWADLPVDVIKRAGSRSEIPAFSRNLENSILNTIRRRPLTLDDLVVLTGQERDGLRRYLDVLEREKKVEPRISGEKIFYVPGAAGA